MRKLNRKGFGTVEGLLIVIIALLVGFIGYYVWHTQKNATNTLNGSNKIAQPTQVKVSPASPNIKYDPPVLIEKASDVDKLKGAPQDFKDFATGFLATNSAPEQDCGSFVMGVGQIYLSEFALGTVGNNGCGGAQALWGKVSGKWQNIFEGQQLADCTIINQYKVPAAIYPQCFGDSGPVNNTN